MERASVKTALLVTDVSADRVVCDKGQRRQGGSGRHSGGPLLRGQERADQAAEAHDAQMQAPWHSAVCLGREEPTRVGGALDADEDKASALSTAPWPLSVCGQV